MEPIAQTVTLTCVFTGAFYLLCASTRASCLLCASTEASRLLCASTRGSRLLCASTRAYHLLCVSTRTSCLLCTSTRASYYAPLYMGFLFIVCFYKGLLSYCSSLGAPSFSCVIIFRGILSLNQ